MEIPTGLAGQLDSYIKQNWTEHLVSIKKVDNTVLTVNRCLPDIFGLKAGEPSDFGVFVDRTFDSDPSFKSLESAVYMPGHSRSLLVARVIFQDQYGNFYRDLDLKGMGLILPGLTTDPAHPIEVPQAGFQRFENGRYGLLNLSDAIEEQSKTAYFASLGIRTYQIAATIRLRQILVSGKPTPAEEVVEDSGFMPVVQLRAFGTKARINDADSRVELGNLYIEDAKKMVAQEFNLKDLSSTAFYAAWYAETLGQQLGKMHKFGWEHGFLTPHNLTLDCRIVDLDSLKRLSSSMQRARDYQIGRNSYATLLSRLEIPAGYRQSPGQILLGIMDRAYINSLNN